MDSRREFIKKAGMLAGGMGLNGVLPASVHRAFAIHPVAGSTYLDAEHIVVLMQENRSFDHVFGSLQGVRGFNDPRAILQPDGNRVWMQKNEKGETYIPFRLNIKETKSTWTGSLPHSRSSQVDARNNGKYDKWLVAKASGDKKYAGAPLTMGYYNREDLPFYYALADAFTVCDQNFSSSLTGTTPNRLYLWTGTVRSEKDPAAHACLTNADVNYDEEASWTTFPERLEDNGIAWKIYQNELSIETGLNADEDAWLGSFADNPIEWFTQYNVRYSKSYRDYLQKMNSALPDQIRELEANIAKLPADAEGAAILAKELKEKNSLLEKINKEKEIFTDDNFNKLPLRERNLHKNAFIVNSNEPFYRDLETYTYADGGKEHSLKIPKGDVLHQFRNDVRKGELPTVSWLVPSENFSDHPDAPWYGAWYVSEVMDILTENTEVWKKTIFILCYDENDGYFDHVPPFIPNDPNVPDSGLASKNLDPLLENVTENNNRLKPRKDSRSGAIGLGFRVPLIIASPWSRGGAVCSEVFDHTSVLQLMEKILTHKTGKKIEEQNISSWRRAVCGDLSSVFHSFDGSMMPRQAFLDQQQVIESVHKAKFMKDPGGFKALTKEEIAQVNHDSVRNSVLPRQEAGVRPACAIAYELYADGSLSEDRTFFKIHFTAGTEVFGRDSAGCPFVVYVPGKPAGASPPQASLKGKQYESGKNWNFAVSPGYTISYLWPVSVFENNNYHLAVYGPNGFFREFRGGFSDPDLSVSFEYERSRRNKRKLTGNVVLTIINNSSKAHNLIVKDNAYNNPVIKTVAGPVSSHNSRKTIILNTAKSFGWYDFTVATEEYATKEYATEESSLFFKRYAGHVETGTLSYTDPAMGGL